MSQAPGPSAGSSADLPTESNTDDNERADDNNEPLDDYIYPKIPSLLGQCRLVISEIAHNERQHNFIELQRLCPSTVKTQRSLTLKGYHLLLVEVGDPSKIIMSLSLDGQILRVVQEINPNSRRPKNNEYFVIGSESTIPDIKLVDVLEFVHSSVQPKAIPADDESTYAVILLYFPNTVEQHIATSELGLHQRESVYLPRLIEDVQRHYIEKYLQDIILYGTPCYIEVCEEFVRLVPIPTNIEPIYGQFVPVPFATRHDETHTVSLNRCATNSFPMQLDSFAQGDASPGLRNNCPFTISSRVFNMKGVLLRKSAQKIILNVHNYFENVYARRVVLQGTPLQMTSQACSLGIDSIGKVLANFKTGTIETPGNPRNRVVRPHKQCQIDKFYADMIRTIIQDIYSAQRPPFANEIYITFKRKVLETENTRRISGEQVTPFTCHEKTFRKILRRLGYRYGKIETRDVLLMRPQIVMWRDKYLNALKKNRASENPKKVIYLDGKIKN